MEYFRGNAFLRQAAVIALLVMFYLTSSQNLAALECAPLKSEKKAEIITYLSRLWKMGNAAQLTLTEGEFLWNTCYRTLLLDGGPLKTPLNLILSPDQRFVSGWLLDLTITPEQVERGELDRIQRLLFRDASPRRGAPDAPITIVEFADFQCPYCKRLNGWMAALPPELRGNVALVFKHLPLLQHSWSREAARSAICASLQSDEAFWAVHDRVFEEQEKLTNATLRVRIADAVTAVPKFDLQAFQSCIATENTESTIARDEALARLLKVTRTPTIFVNGARAESPHSFEEFEKLLTQGLRPARESGVKAEIVSW